MNKRDAGIVLAGLALGLGAGVGAAGCGEDRDEGSVEVEGATTGGTTATTSTTGTGTTSTTGTTEEGTSTAAGPAEETVKLTETEYAIKPARVRVAAGVVEFRVRNDGGIAHALEVESEELEEETEDIAPGQSATLKVDLPAGTYELYCPIGDHEDRGMKGELVVGG
jgi:uncharacterized cupredoxin-like copper-binding protein